MATKKFNINWIWLAVPLFFIIAIIVYLSTESCYRQFCATGWEILGKQWPSFWIWVAVGTAAGLFFGWRAYVTEKRGGSTGRVWAFAILAILLLTTPWGKACT